MGGVKVLLSKGTGLNKSTCWLYSSEQKRIVSAFMKMFGI